MIKKVAVICVLIISLLASQMFCLADNTQQNSTASGTVVMASAGNGIHVNHLGYYPILEKKATLVSSASTPVEWMLKDNSGTVVKSGTTTVFGFDKPSGDNVHIIDFSSFTTPGKDYQLTSGSAVSATFDIGNDIYSQLKYDALRYFYHNRSGIEIKLPYSIEPQWARPAGHLPDVAPCAPSTWYNETYELDVTRGWYDAGDHGKYVVNGGISVWTMMNQYERAKIMKSLAPFEDGKMNLPESSNGVPDILDEARWEMEFMLKMQVPQGKSKEGMVHHKMHDVAWTGLATAPHQDTMQRYLRPPSTAATLNLAATGAQAARLFEQYDSDFAGQCLTAAEKAWNAALANPAIYAPASDTTGGGPYNDNYVKDDFYWAAAELYITTGKDIYLNYIKSSQHYLEMPTRLVNGESGVFDWGTTSGLGTISLALVPGGLPQTDVDTAKNNIKKAADYLINVQNNQGYGIPIEEYPISGSLTGYPWGSNSFVVNIGIVMGYAFDFSEDNKYLNGLAESMDYIMGRNPLHKSYVSGYGEDSLENPHHRFWAYQAHPSWPKPPPGCLSGGPNSSVQDPYIQFLGYSVGKYPAQKCYVDHIESWSTNEITINWNAPLAWVTAYLDEKGAGISLPVIMYGDLNDDKVVDSTDLTLMKRYNLKITQDIVVEAADLNIDGSVDSTDLTLLKRYLLKIIDTLPWK